MSTYTTLNIGETLVTIKMDKFRGSYFSIVAHIDMMDCGDLVRLALAKLRIKTPRHYVHGYFEPEYGEVIQHSGDGSLLKSLDAKKVLKILKKHGVADYRRNKMAIDMLESAIANGFHEVVVYIH